MSKNLKHSAYKLLNRSGLRFALAASAAAIATVRVGKLCRVSYKGEWVQKFPTCTLVEPRLTLWTPEQIQRMVADYFMYQYHPQNRDTIIDVGAGTGWETLFFSRGVGKFGRVVSIEAHPRVFSCLSKMCAENRLENVTLVNAAAADQEREVQFSDSPDHEANGMVEVGSGIRVRCTTLDHLFRSLGLSHVDFLKMNIEGAEVLALSGAEEMIRKTKKVCIACHDFLADEGGPDELRTRARVIAFLENNGFTISLRGSDGDFIQNYVYGVNENLLAG